ncbi:MAG: filamentous hemagglutinin N-terminal domain-containing protein [Nitrosomonadales bacterium]|nr:filamentous hemagglutinin N-terminal domain-containing protein [Nitrosomonadales bacterium]
MTGKTEHVREVAQAHAFAGRQRTGKHARFRVKPLCAAVLLAFTVQTVQANPVGGVVSSGQASFATSGNTLTVTNTPGAIINWQGFSIGKGETTRFAQQSAASSVLNRVVSNNPSSILGTLSSNGRVFLINPNGIVFGQGAVVDVAGMVASTLKLSDADFLAGRHRYTPLPPGEAQGVGGVANAGSITARGDGLGGGQIYLIAPNVENTGIINAPNGEILLAAGHSVELVNSNDPNLRVNITAPAGDATNVGKLIVESGSLGLFGTVVRNSGTASADSAVMQGGRIVFKASQRVEAGGAISAQGTSGGSINLQGDTAVAVGGAVNADGAQGGAITINAGSVSMAGSLTARGTTGQGGSISIQSQTTNLNNVHTTLDVSGASGGTIREIAGHQITSSATYLAAGTAGNGGRIDLSAPATKLLSAQIDASGATGGGQIRLGGEYQGGKNLAVDELPNAETLAVSAGSVIKADATQQGNGGTVILWSNLHSALYADVSAKPAGNGAGGFIELSSADKLTWGGTANAGVGGQVLMDPKNIVIQDATAGGVQYNLTLGYNYVNLPRMKGNNLVGGDLFGSAVSLSGTQLAVGANYDDGFGNVALDSGAVYLFNDPFTTPTLSGIIGKGYTGAGNYNLTALEANDQFGSAVSLSGTQLAVGAVGDSGVGNLALNSGAVYLFNTPFTAPALSGIIGKGYTGAGSFDVSALAANDQFGSAVSLSGTQLAVGAMYDDGSGDLAGNSGAVYLFNNPFGTTALSGIIGKGYTGVGSFDVTALAASDWFGSAVSLSGTQLAVGAMDDDGFGNAASASGAVYLFNNLDTTPTLSGIIGKGYTGAGNYNLTALEGGDAFGRSVSLSGTQLAVGASWDDGFGNAAMGSGAVYLFNTPFATPTLSGTIGLGYVGAGDFNLTTLAAEDHFGSAVSLSGTQLAVGAFADDSAGNLAMQSGAVYLFNNPFTAPALSGIIGKGYTGKGNFDPGDALAADDYFGYSVSLSGTQLAVGAYGDGGSGDLAVDSGAVYLFNNPFSTPALSGIIGKGYTGAGNHDLTALEANDYFGFSVSLSGTQLAVGAFWDGGSGNAAPGSGAVYLFNNPFSTPALSGILGKGYTGAGNYDLAALEAYDHFGSAVSLSGTQLAVGARFDGGSGNAAAYIGAVYLFNTPFGTPALSGIIGKGYTGAGNYDLAALEADDYFGNSVSLSGTQLAVGARFDDGSGNAAAHSGAVYLFNTPFGTPALSGTIGKGYTGAGNYDLTALEAYDSFGFSVSLSGTQLAVGAYGDGGSGNAASGSGAVYLFNNPFSTPALSGILGKGYTGAGNYDLAALEAGDLFGTSVSLSGTQLAVGAYGDGGSGNAAAYSGAVYLFTLGAGGSGDPATGQTFANNPGLDSTITPASITAILDTGSALTLQANNDITVMNAILANNPTGNGGALTMQAGRSILVNANIDTDNGALTLTANDPGANAAYRDAGAAVLDVSMATLTAGSIALANSGGDILAGAMTANLGAINLIASDNISVASGLAVSSLGDAQNVVFNADSDGIGGGSIMMGLYSSVTSNGGNIIFGGGNVLDGFGAPTGNAIGTATNSNGIYLTSATLDAGGGNIALNGQGYGTGSLNMGVHLSGATLATAGAGTITLNGIGGGNNTPTTNTSNRGIRIEGATSVTSASGAIALTGTGGWDGDGVQILGGSTVQSTSGAITITGHSGDGGTNYDVGVYLDDANTEVSSGGNITITGVSHATSGTDNSGIYLTGSSSGNAAAITATGNGTITLNGTGGAGTNYNSGVTLGTYSTVSSVNGAISFTGQGAGSGADNFGLYLHNGATVTATGTGAITLDGTASAGATSTSNHGVRISASGGPTQIASASGAISITGVGKNDGDGLQVVSGAIVQSGTGAITLNGTGGNGGSANDGVYVTGAGTLVTSGGNIGITGDNSNLVGSGNRGVAITSSAQVVATGAATITVIGQGGHEGDGLHVHGGALVQSGTGLITLTGTSGDGIGTNWDWGVEVGDLGTLVTSGGGMTITGISTSTDGTYSNYGLFVRTGAKLTTTAGLMTLTGTKGAGATSDAVRLSGTPTGGVVNAAAGLNIIGMGDVVVDTGTILNVAGNANIFATNNILLSAGGSLAPSAGAFNIALNSDSDGTGGGGIYLDTGSSLASNGGNITMGGMPSVGYATGNGTVTGGITFNSGIYVLGDITAGAGNVTMRGEGANNNFADGITFAGGTLSGNGTVTIDGLAHGYSTGTSAPNLFAAGVDFLGAGTRLTTQTGTVTITGVNDAPDADPYYYRADGIMVETGTILETTGSGTLTLNGTANSFNTSWGLGVVGGTIQTTANTGGGAITLNGTNASGLADGGVVILGGNVLSNGGEIRMIGAGLGGSVGIISGSAIGGASSGNILIKANNSGAVDLASGSSINAGASVLTLSLAGGTANDNDNSITAGALRLLGSGTFNLGGTGNNVGTLAANVTGNVTYNDTNGFAIGNVTSFDGAAATTTTGVTATGSAILNAVGAITTSGGVVAANALNVGATGGIALTTQVANLTTVNSGAGNTLINNTGALTVGGMTDTSGSYAEQAGDVTVTGWQVGVSANGIFLTASGAASDITVSGLMTSTGGMTINAGGNIFVEGTVNSASGMTIVAGGNLTLDDSVSDVAELISSAGTQTVTVGGNLTLIDANGGTYMYGASGQTITVGGNLDVQGGSISSGAGATLHVGNDLLLSDSASVGSATTLFGSVGHDVKITGGAYGITELWSNSDIGSASEPFSVGGRIYLVEGDSYGSRIHSNAIDSIWINFPNLSGGGYFLDGVEGVVSGGSSGFYASYYPAFLDSNLHITYGAASSNNLSFLPDLVNTMLIPGGGAAGASQSTIGNPKKNVPPPVVVVDDKAPPADSNAPALPVCPQ